MRAAESPSNRRMTSSGHSSELNLIDNVVFDLGGVLIGWDPRALFRTYYPDDQALDRFLIETDFFTWNAYHDRGGSWEQAVETVSRNHPEHAAAFGQYVARFGESLVDALPGSLELLRELHESATRLLCITNWATSTFNPVRGTYPWLQWFEAIVVSGEEGVMKPEPAIFQILIDRHHVEPARSVFVDDQPINVAAAQGLGFVGVVFRDPEQLRAALRELGLPSTYPRTQ